MALCCREDAANTMFLVRQEACGGSFLRPELASLNFERSFGQDAKQADRNGRRLVTSDHPGRAVVP